MWFSVLLTAGRVRSGDVWFAWAASVGRVSGPKSGDSVLPPATAQANGSQGGGPSALHPVVRF
jgi:hypothetical protein